MSHMHRRRLRTRHHMGLPIPWRRLRTRHPSPGMHIPWRRLRARRPSLGICKPRSAKYSNGCSKSPRDARILSYFRTASRSGHSQLRAVDGERSFDGGMCYDKISYDGEFAPS